MGEGADEGYESAMLQQERFFGYLKNTQKLSDKEIFEELHNVMTQDFYEDNKFTPMVSSILEQFESKGSITKKQRNVLDNHLANYYCETDFDPY